MFLANITWLVLNVRKISRSARCAEKKSTNTCGSIITEMYIHTILKNLIRFYIKNNVKWKPGKKLGWKSISGVGTKGSRKLLVRWTRFCGKIHSLVMRVFPCHDHYYYILVFIWWKISRGCPLLLWHNRHG